MGVSSHTTWADYWNKNNIWSESTLWRKQMAAFIRLSDSLLHYDTTDRVLDFGCGSGHFAEMMQTRVGSIVCADMSEHFVNVCRRKFEDSPNVSTYRIAADLSDLQKLGRGYTKVICLSVVHYFERLEQLAKFIRAMQQVCLPGARLLIADIANNHQTMADMFRKVIFASREGLLPDAAFMTLKMLFSKGHYRKIRRGGHSYLYIPEGFLETLCTDINVEMTYVHLQLTLNAHHKTVLIKF